MSIIRISHYLPIALGAVIDWANIVALDFISCTPVTLPTLIRDIKGHSKRLLMRLSIRLYANNEVTW